MFFHVGSKTTASFAIVLVCFSSFETGDLSKKVGVSKHPGAQGHARTSHQTETNTSGLMPFWVPVLVSGRVNKFWHKQKTHAPKQDKAPQTKFCRVSQPSNPPIINNQKKKHNNNISQGTLPGMALGGPPFPSATSLGSRTSITKGSLRPWGFFRRFFRGEKYHQKRPTTQRTTWKHRFFNGSNQTNRFEILQNHMKFYRKFQSLVAMAGKTLLGNMSPS